MLKLSDIPVTELPSADELKSDLVKATNLVRHTNATGSSVRSARAMLNVPIYALRVGNKAGRRFSVDGFVFSITCNNTYGNATVNDEDIVFWLTSELVARLNAGEPVSEYIDFCPRFMLRDLGRGTGGKDYERLVAALMRLQTTQIRIDDATTGKIIMTSDSIIGPVSVVADPDTGESWARVRLSDWLYQKALRMEVLRLTDDYYRIREPMTKRLYKIARYHCGNQTSWSVGLATMYDMVEYNSPLKKFRAAIARMQDTDIPEYKLLYDRESDKATFKRKKT